MAKHELASATTPPTQAIVVASDYKTFFFSPLIAVGVILLIDAFLAVFADTSKPGVAKVMDLCADLAKLCAGAFLGLIGGKAAS